MKSKQCQQQNKTLEQNSAGTWVDFAKLLLKIKVYWPAAETTRYHTPVLSIVVFNTATHV